MKMNAVQISLSIFILIGIALFLGCNQDECNDSDECLNKYRISFEPVDLEGENLFQNPDSIYSSDSIRLFSGSPSIDLSFTASKVVLILNQAVNQFIIDFSKNKIDTFYIDKKYEDSE